uniref:Uncharacterized protein n=1 Tax=Plectus sambesii TaxID=2011161 RepID=A0A914VSH0_9BILA
MHLLIAHLREFAKRHKTLGLLSEQALESLHAKIASIAQLKQMNLTEPFHGSGGLENMFMITTLAAYRGRHKNTFRRCQACDVDLPAPGTVDAPLDIILSH